MTENIARHASAFIDKGLTGYGAYYAALAKELEGRRLTFDDKTHHPIMDPESPILYTNAFQRIGRLDNLYGYHT